MRCGNVAQAGARVTLAFQDPAAQAEFGGDYTTDIAGHLVLPHVVPSRGTATIRIDHPYARFVRTRTVPLDAVDAPTNVLCQFPSGCAALLGRVRVDRGPPLNVMLVLKLQVSGETISTEILKDGDFALNYLPAGRADATVTIRSDQGVYVNTLPLHLRPGMIARIDLSL